MTRVGIRGCVYVEQDALVAGRQSGGATREVQVRSEVGGVCRMQDPFGCGAYRMQDPFGCGAYRMHDPFGCGAYRMHDPFGCGAYRMHDPFGGGAYSVTGAPARCVERLDGELHITTSPGDVITLRAE